MRLIPTLLASTLFSLAFAKPEASPPGLPFAVIAAPGTTAQSLSRESVSLMFRRRQNYWEDGTRIQPVNLPASHALRQAFSQCIFGRRPESMEDYWREMYFHGVLPPHVLASEEAVVLFVLSTPGAIGYVSSCPADSRINVVLTVGDVPNCQRHNATCAPLQD
jgi:ABC-type phosphate transport system substrate-binding protein